ncbi:hypothetical protein ACWGTI_21990 [Mesorhizobium sp. ArgA1]
MTSFSDSPAAWFKGRFSRRAVLIRAVASAPVVVAAAAIGAPEPVEAARTISRTDLLMAYSEWLHFERLMLQRDLYGDNVDVH